MNSNKINKMGNDINQSNVYNTTKQTNEVSYNSDKDFYQGLGGEMRFNAEGLQKKAKEKGISIYDIEIITLAQKTVDFPGIGNVDLHAYIAKVRGKELSTGREVVDVKQIDYFNIYQKYIVNKIEKKNSEILGVDTSVSSEETRADKKTPEISLTQKDRFEIGKAIIADKEFGLEKTVTGACDRVIRKLIGENGWLYPLEAKMLETEFDEVDNRKSKEVSNQNLQIKRSFKKASNRQKDYLKVKIKNGGLNPDSEETVNRVVSETGFVNKTIDDLSMAEMSKVIDSVPYVLPKIRQEYE